MNLSNYLNKSINKINKLSQLTGLEDVNELGLKEQIRKEKYRVTRIKNITN